MYWFVHLAVTSELNPWDAYSPGRLDQHLYPFYQKDMTEGILDDEKALELHLQHIGDEPKGNIPAVKHRFFQKLTFRAEKRGDGAQGK